jgi:hypothetical protein
MTITTRALGLTAVLWLPLAMAITFGAGLVYVAGQQSYRSSLNDPQIQIARESAALAGSGVPLSTLIPTERIDVATSLATIILFYGDDGAALGGSGVLNGKQPQPPSGVFTSAKTHGENRITWQPATSVRLAAVIRYFHGTQSGYVVVARNMSEGEQRITSLGDLVLIVWLISLATTLASTLVLTSLRERHQ